MTDQCSDCAHAFVGEVKVDFDGPGYLDFDCEMERVMTDEDCEMCDEGRCPYYERMEDEVESESKYVRGLRIGDECPRPPRS